MLETVPTPGDTSWFVHDRFGLFIHWGTYALAARHEWVKQREEIDDDVYMKYFRHFEPDLYDPEAWADAAAAAGMKYFVITTKHHEGFCLWDTKLTDYKATKAPCGKDLLKPMVEAFRSRGIKVGFYHSLIDWHHEHYIVDDLHSQRNHPDRAKMNEGRDQKKYIEFLHGQVRELLTDFGHIDILWFDFSYPKRDEEGKSDPYKGKGREDWGAEELYKMVRELQPHVILDDRLDLPDGWDVKTPEQIQPREWVKVDGKPVVWEACQTFSGSWGYHRDEASWKSVPMLIQMLIDTVSKGGNLLLNVGPTARGEFDARSLDRLAGMGEWMKRHSRSIYGCTQAPEGFKAPRDCRLTYNPKTNRMYVHVFAWPFKTLDLEGFGGKVEYVQLLNDASEIPMTVGAWEASQLGGDDSSRLTLTLPVQAPDVVVPVLELYLKGWA